MTFLVMVVVYAMMQWGVNYRGIQQDQWLWRWSATVRRLGHINPEVAVCLLAGLPALLLLLGLTLLVKLSGWLLLVAAVPLLLYSIGRHEIAAGVQSYVEAWRRGDNAAAAEIAAAMGVEADTVDNWSLLHRLMLRQAAWLGFERLFAVLFWFVVLGPVGGFLYRVLCLCRDDGDNRADVQLAAARAVWLLEWPAVRLLGLSFALTGNFVGCFQQLKLQLTEIGSSTPEVLETFIHGALNVNSTAVIAEDITEQEVEALLPLLSRTMILWLCVVAFSTLFG